MQSLTLIVLLLKIPTFFSFYFSLSFSFFFFLFFFFFLDSFLPFFVPSFSSFLPPFVFLSFPLPLSFIFFSYCFFPIKSQKAVDAPPHEQQAWGKAQGIKEGQRKWLEPWGSPGHRWWQAQSQLPFLCFHPHGGSERWWTQHSEHIEGPQTLQRWAGSCQPTSLVSHLGNKGSPRLRRRAQNCACPWCELVAGTARGHISSPSTWGLSWVFLMWTLWKQIEIFFKKKQPE